MVVQRFCIGDIDAMAKTAIGDANAGHNVYVEARTVRPGLARGSRGTVADTVAVFALVADRDADKGRSGNISFVPSLVVEVRLATRTITSSCRPNCRWKKPTISVAACAPPSKATTTPARSRSHFVLPARPTTPARLSKRVVGASHPLIISSNQKVWTREQLFAAFPPTSQTQLVLKSPKAAAASATERSKTSFANPARTGRAGSMTFREGSGTSWNDAGDLEDVMRRHPNGCAAKYLTPTDRLRKEIERSWGKLGARG